jgi:hypothetical protein
VRDCFEVRILPRDLETEAGSLIAVRHVDAAAEANAASFDFDVGLVDAPGSSS